MNEGGSWPCGACTFSNTPGPLACSICQTEKPTELSGDDESPRDSKAEEACKSEETSDEANPNEEKEGECRTEEDEDDNQREEGHIPEDALDNLTGIVDFPQGEMLQGQVNFIFRHTAYGEITNNVSRSTLQLTPSSLLLRLLQ